MFGLLQSGNILRFALLFGIAITLFFGYRYVTNLQNDNAELRVEVSALETVVESRNQQIADLRSQMAMVEQQIDRLREIDESSTLRIRELESRIFDIQRAEREKAIREGTRASLFLRIINNNTKCQWENFTDFTGECNAAGQWRPHD